MNTRFILTFFLAITNDMTDENIEEGFSVFVFMLTGLSLMVFAARVLWVKRKDAAQQNKSAAQVSCDANTQKQRKQRCVHVKAQD